jgi:hypothetical protein
VSSRDVDVPFQNSGAHLSRPLPSRTVATPDRHCSESSMSR